MRQQRKLDENDLMNNGGGGAYVFIVYAKMTMRLNESFTLHAELFGCIDATKEERVLHCFKL